MTNLEQKTLSFGENYSLGQDLYAVLENLNQHLFTDSFKRMFPEVADDLEDFAKLSGSLNAQIMGMAEDLGESKDPFTHSIVLAAMCIRYALYCANGDERESEGDES